MLHAAAREGLFCPTYCLMPDHIHLVWMGLRRKTDQKNGMKFLCEHLAPKLRPHHFQHQAHGHVLREEQRRRNAFAKVCFYIIDNARKEGMVEHLKDWRFCGTVIPGYPAMHSLEQDFWPKPLENLFGRACSRRREDCEAIIPSADALCDMLHQLKPSEEEVNRLTSTATIVDVLDDATSEIASGSKLGIDATKKLLGEGFKPWPPLIKMDEAVKANVEKLFNL